MLTWKSWNYVYQPFDAGVLVCIVYNIIKFKLRDEETAILMRKSLVINTEERKKKRVEADVKGRVPASVGFLYLEGPEAPPNTVPHRPQSLSCIARDRMHFCARITVY